LFFKLAKILECINETSAPESTKALNFIWKLIISDLKNDVHLVGNSVI
jgi:hypothetical protein